MEYSHEILTNIQSCFIADMADWSDADAPLRFFAVLDAEDRSFAKQLYEKYCFFDKSEKSLLTAVNLLI